MNVIMTYNGIRIPTSNTTRMLPLSELGSSWSSVSPVSSAYRQQNSIDAASAISFPEPAKPGSRVKILGRLNNHARRRIGYAVAALMLMTSGAGAQAQSRESRREDPQRTEQRADRPSSGPGKEADNRHHSAAPPEDFSELHNLFHSNRQQIGAGPKVPRSVSIQQGRPLPKGYGKRLDDRALRGMPRYEGYEWRRVGTDIVLVAVTTGVVYAILKGVLND
ncbi:RcnB family protein [Halopseudomonas pelagia]|uniref:RcnB family protein n=1 Tax=Halopseudomonas pelagia TaxID=553151 RepID=UPI0030DDAE39